MNTQMNTQMNTWRATCFWWRWVLDTDFDYLSICLHPIKAPRLGYVTTMKDGTAVWSA